MCVQVFVATPKSIHRFEFRCEPGFVLVITHPGALLYTAVLTEINVRSQSLIEPTQTPGSSPENIPVRAVQPRPEILH